MTLKELKLKVNAIPERYDSEDVMIEQTNDEFRFSLLEKAEMKDCHFSEESSLKVVGKAKCLILSDEI